MTSSRLARPLAILLALALVGITASAASAAPESLATITLPPNAGAQKVAFGADGKYAYVTLQDIDKVAVIDVASSTVLTLLSVGDGPIGIAVSPDGTKAYVTHWYDNNVWVIDTATNAVVGSPIPVGSIPISVVFSPDGTKAYTANYGTNTVSVISTGTATVTGSIVTTKTAPQFLVLSPDGSEIWISNGASADGVVDVASTTSNLVLGTVTLPDPSPSIKNWAYDLAITPDGSTVYVTDVNDQAGKFYAITTATRTLDPTKLITTPNYAAAIEISRDGTTAYAVYGQYGSSETPLKNGLIPVDLATGVQGPVIATGGSSRDVAVSPEGGLVYVLNGWSSTITVVGEPVTRLSGSDRYETSVAASQQAFPAQASVVFVATGSNYPDALSAGPAAARMGGPLLLTDPGALPASIKAEIQRLQPIYIYVIGGVNAVSNAVVAQLAPLAPTPIVRVSGADRYATSRAVTSLAFGAGTTEVYVATGRNFPDALSASGAGAAFGRPVILVDGGATTVDAPTLSLLSSLNTTKVIIAGGTSVVSPSIEDQLETVPGIDVNRAAGANRYDTAYRIVHSAGYTPPVTRVFLATGTNFPDALSGSAMAGTLGAPLFIVQPTCVPADVLTEIAALDAKQITLIGGPNALSPGVFGLTPCS